MFVHILGVVGYNYLYTTTDVKQIPKILNENGMITDYTYFLRQAISDPIFALPTYCFESAPTNCPLNLSVESIEVHRRSLGNND